MVYKDVGESLQIISYQWFSNTVIQVTHPNLDFTRALVSNPINMIFSVFLLVSLAMVNVIAEPPPVYGPPGFGSSGYRAPSFGGGSGGYSGGGGGGYSGGEGGAPEPFNFKYEVKDAPSGNDYSHQASSDGRRVQGEYRVLLPDGRRQIVKYTADDNGYNADVQYEGQAKYPQGGGGGGGGYPSGGGSGGGGFGGYHY